MRIWLKALRMKQGKTQEEIAKAINISQSAYCKIENGSRQSDLNCSVMLRLSQIFSISIELIAVYEKMRTKK